MPELPEVESLRRILARSATGLTIVSAKVLEPRLRRKVSHDFEAAIAGRRIEALARRAKYLILELAGGDALLVHLGMSGSLTHRPGNAAAGGPAFADHDESLDPAHDHVEFRLDDGSRIVYNDPRRFGLLKLVPAGTLDSTVELRGLGPEPLGKAFSAEYLALKARGRRVAIKNLLMDQRIVAGIGNIYAAEILFRAAVRPTRRAGRLSRAEIARIAAATRSVLREAIGKRGTTFRSYRDSRGQPGGFSSRLRVYGREGEACYTCSTPIRNVIIGQRASFFCPQCQK
jgi:formamidopyrimidine-DNA glycosylase